MDGRSISTVVSRNGPPHLELIQSLGSDAHPEPLLDHLALWTADLAGAERHLVRQGFRIESSHPDLGYGFYRGKVGGLRLEVVDVVARPRWDARIA
jgi:hypothetical protein